MILDVPPTVQQLKQQSLKFPVRKLLNSKSEKFLKILKESRRTLTGLCWAGEIRLKLTANYTFTDRNWNVDFNPRPSRPISLTRSLPSTSAFIFRFISNLQVRFAGFSLTPLRNKLAFAFDAFQNRFDCGKYLSQWFYG